MEKMIEKIKNKYNTTTKEAKTIATILDKLKLANIEEAYEVFSYDCAIEKSPMNKAIEGEVVVQKPKKTKKTGIQLEELDAMKTILSTLYSDGEEFQNKDLNGLREELDLNARQTPSRLKRLVEEGFLEDVGGTPKKYKVKS